MRLSTALLGLAILAGCKGTVGDPVGDDPPPPPPPDTTRSFVASESVARRLSQAELDRTLADLLGDTSGPAVRFLSEDEFSPYDNDYTLQQASGALIDGLEVLAAEVARGLVADPMRRDRLVGCTPASDGDEDCFRAFLGTFLRRAFRREVAPAEIDPYVALLAYATEDIASVDNDFYSAVELAIRAVLQDPEFLYRIEIGAAREDGARTLNGYEVASRLSYFLWGSMPDDALLDDAAAGRLDDAAGRRAAAERMLGDDKAKAHLFRFHAMWLGYRAIPHGADLVTRFNRETNALIDRVVFERRPYTELYLSDETFVDDVLADHYGLSRPTGGEGWVAYANERAGILSHGSVLASFSKFTDTSPTQRGILVRTRLMCDVLESPPANVDVDQPPEGDPDDCKTDRYRAHMGASGCVGCHAQMDPIGFGLERYDIAGRYRTHDDGREECGIEGVGNLPGGTTFSGPRELAVLLTDSGELQNCTAQQVFAYAVGRAPKGVEFEMVSDLTASFRAHDRFDLLLLDYVASDAFGLKKEATP